MSRTATRIADKNVASIDLWLPGEQLDRQIAVNPHFPTGTMGKVAANGAAHLIPVQKIKNDDQNKQQCQQSDARPSEKPAPSEAKIGDAFSRAAYRKFLASAGHEKSTT